MMDSCLPVTMTLHYYRAPPLGVEAADAAARFFPLPDVVFVFFFARVTLMGGGVPVRGASSSTS